MPDVESGLVFAGAIGVIVIGLGVIVLVSSMLRRLKEDDALPRSVVGRPGVVTSAIAGAGGAGPHGEVSLDQELESRIAFADEPIAPGTRVVVVEQYGSRVKVVPRS